MEENRRNWKEIKMAEKYYICRKKRINSKEDKEYILKKKEIDEQRFD